MFKKRKLLQMRKTNVHSIEYNSISTMSYPRKGKNSESGWRHAPNAKLKYKRSSKKWVLLIILRISLVSFHLVFFSVAKIDKIVHWFEQILLTFVFIMILTTESLYIVEFYIHVA